MHMLVRPWDAVSANILKNCFRKASVSEETQVASINDEDHAFKLLEEKVNELKSRGLVDGGLTVDVYVNIDFEVCTSETSAITDRQILDSILIKNYDEEEEDTDEDSKDMPPEKPKLLEIANATELLECWSLFDNSGAEIRQSLSLIKEV